MDPKHRTVTRFSALVLVTVAAGLVSGCLYSFEPAPTRREPEPNLVEYRHDVEFAAGRFSLSREQGRELQAFVDRVGIAYGDRIYVATPSTEGIEGEVARRLAERRAESVSSFLGINDVDVDAVIDDYGDEPPLGDVVTVLVQRYVVTLPACPDWSDSSMKKFTNQTANYWSCATAINLGVMVADPGDLVRGRQAGPGDGQLLADSIYRYRLGETKPLNIGDVGTAESFTGTAPPSANSPSASGN